MSRTAYEISLGSVVFVLTFAALAWAMNAFLGLSLAKALLALSPAILIGGIAAAYGYSIGWKARRGDSLPFAKGRAIWNLTLGLMICVWNVAALMLALLTFYLLFQHRFALGLFLAVVTNIVGVLGANMLLRALKRSKHNGQRTRLNVAALIRIFKIRP